MDNFAMFSTIHFLWLIMISGFVCLLVYKYINSSITEKNFIQKVIFYMLVLLECSKQIYLVATGSYSYWSPPLHLCGLGIILIGWHTYFPNKSTAEVLYSLTLPGAIAALIFPGWTNEPVFGFIHGNSFIFHALLIGYVVMLLAAKELVPRIQNLWRSVLFLLITVPPTYFYNITFGTNFMFINRPLKGSPLETLEQTLGNPGYLIGFASLLLIVWALMYLPFVLRALHKK